MFRSILAILLALAFARPVLAGGTDEAFIDMVKAGNVEAVELCLAQGRDPDTKDWAGWTALAWAALLLKTDVIEHLVGAGADIDYVSPGGKNSGTPLMMAAKKYHGRGTVAQLIALGAGVNATDQFGRTALWMAARYGRLETVELLLAHGADPSLESTDRKAKTAVDIARSRGHSDVAALLEKKAKNTP
jgi:ankyrin repeat protein